MMGARWLDDPLAARETASSRVAAPAIGLLGSGPAPNARFRASTHAPKFAMVGGEVVAEGPSALRIKCICILKELARDVTPYISQGRRRGRRDDIGGGACDRAINARDQVAPDLELSESLDTIYGTAQTFAKYVADATDNKFQIQTFAAGEIVPGLQALDAVSSATVEMAQTPLYFYIGKELALAYATGAPFGMNHRHQHSWWSFGGGAELCNEALKPFKTHAILCGNSGTQMGGWFRKEIKTVEDLQGLKFRIAGMGGHVLAKLEIVPQQIAGGEVYSALEKGSIDAAEFVGPYDDEKLGFYKVAKYYYFPAGGKAAPCCT